MVMSAHMLVVVYGERPVGDKDLRCCEVTTRLQYSGCGVVRGQGASIGGFHAPNWGDRAPGRLAF